MKGQRNTLVKVLLAVMLVICSFGFFGCKPAKDDKESTNYGEVGYYYFTAIEDEYELVLEDGRYSLTIEGVLMTGSYAYDGAVLSLYAENEGGKTIIGSIKGATLTITYNGGTYTFYKKVDYTVQFDVDGGSAVAPVTVVNGKTLTKPADPTKEGYCFVGWYADKDYTKPFVFGSDIITANTTLYARFVAQSATGYEYTATLYVDGEVLETKTTIGGVLYTLPTPENTDKTFVGWWVSDYQDAEKLTYKYEAQALTQNVNLYAVWASDALQISVNSTGATWSAIRAGVEYTVTIKSGDTLMLAPYKTTGLSVDYDFAAYDAGDYTVIVEAEGKTTVAYYKNKALARVSNFSFTEPSTLVFEGVENAEKYLITVVCGNANHNHENYDNGNSTNYNFANCAMKEGGIEFVVTAVATGYVSSVSDTLCVYNPMLDAVSGVQFDLTSGVLTWDAVENATSYVVTVTVDGLTETYSLTETALSMTKYTGDITVTLKAINVAFNSPAATQFTCSINKLASPVPQYVEDKVVWAAVEGAKSYIVKVDGDEYPVSGTEFTLPEKYNVNGQTSFISVKAVADEETKNSYYSEEISVSYGEIAYLEYSANNLRWGAVAGASSYVVKVGTLQVAKGDSSLRSAEITFKSAGDNTIMLLVYNAANKVITYKSVTVKTYAITLDVQGGSAVKTVYAAEGDKLSIEETKKQYYIFAGWYNMPGGAEGNGALFDTAKDTVTGEMTLYAYWTPVPFEVELKVGVTLYNPETSQFEYVIYETYTELVYYQCSYILPIPEIEDKSKVFYGWYGDDNIESTPYTDADGKSILKWTKTTGYTLYAGWVEALAYTLEEGINGKSWHITQGVATKMATEITVPATYTDPLSKQTYPVTHIDTGAFAKCTKLEVLNIPDTLESIFLAFGSTTSSASSASALYECTKLKAVNVYCVDEDGVHDENSTHKTYYSSVDGLLLRHASPNMETLDHGVELVFVPYNRKGTLVIPDGVQHIPSRVFYWSLYEKIVVPASVTRISDRAFARATSREIVFEEAPAGVEEKTLELTEGVFMDMVNLTELTLPTRIGLLDFEGTNLVSSNRNLVKINIVGRPTPEQKASKQYYTSNNGVICNYDGTELVFVPKYLPGTYTIPVAIQVIGERAFMRCQELQTVVIKDNVKTIKSEAFLGCQSLSSVVFEYDGGSLEIESKAFYECTNLYSIEFPKQLKYLGSYAFGNTPKLTTVTINGASNAILEWGAFAEETGRNKGYVTNIHLGAGAPAFDINSVFYGCNLYVLDVNEYNRNFNQIDGVLYNSDKTEILYYPYGMTENYVIPDTITRIGQGVFENRANITSIEIPASVTEIGFYAFRNCVGLTNLTFAPRTTPLNICASAFENCIALTTVSLPEGMTEIAGWAFANCTNITTIHIPSTMTEFVLADAFYGCKKIKTITVASANEKYGIEDGILYEKNNGKLVSVLFVPNALTGEVEIPSTVTSIGEAMFSGKSGITAISFENNKASEDLVLGASVFANMTSLTEVRLPDGLKVIPTNAFKGSSITSVYVPNSVEKVMPGAFANCKKLTTVTFEDGGNELVFQDASTANSAFYNTPNLTSIKLPNRMTALGKYMFANSSIANITFPSDLNLIGEGAFVNCKNLKTIVMPNTVTEVEMLAFSGCTSLESVTLSSQLTAIPDYLFAAASKGTGTTSNGSSSGGGNINDGGIPIVPPSGKANKTPQYKDDPVSNNNSDVAVGLLEDVESCTALKSIIIPAGVVTIGKYAFRGCTAMATVSFEATDTLRSLGDYAFMDTGITAFNMPNSVISIGIYQFAGCENLVSLTISSSVTVIPEGMCDKQYRTDNIEASQLQPCSSLTAIVIPDGITAIGKYAFRKTTALTSVTFEEGSAITTIAESAFEGSAIKTLDLSKATASKITLDAFAFRAALLETVNLPFSVKSLGTAFIGCDTIKKFEIEDDGDAYLDNNYFNVDAESLVVYNADRDEIRLYAGNAEEFVIPDGVTKIYYNAFRSNTTLKKVTIPKSVRYIEDAAFAFCTNLAQVIIPDDAELLQIGFRAFAFSGLKEISIPASVTKLGAHSYSLGAPSEDEIAAYNDWFINVAQYGDNANGSQVKDGWEISKTTWQGRVFEGCGSLESVIISTTASCEYMFLRCASLSNVQFNNSDIRQFSDYQFAFCSSLKTIDLPWLLTWPAQYAFAHSGLTEITLPKGMQVQTSWSGYYDPYGAGMFAGCEDLKKVTIPENYQVIPDNMFQRSGLEEVTLPTNIKEIGQGAFAWCENLKTVVFPEECTNLTLMDNAFGDSGMEGDLDFSNMTLSLTDGKGIVAKEVFRGTKITSIKFADDITEFGAYLFYGCENLRTIEVNNLKAVGHNCFAHCTSLESISFADDATTIGLYAFQDCTSLKEINIPDSVTDIGEDAFWNTGLESVTIGTGITYIPLRAFMGSKLKTVHISSAVTLIEPSAFLMCDELQSFTVDEANTDYRVGDYGELYNKTTNQLMFFPAGVTGDFTMETGTSLCSYAFYGSSLTSVTISAATSVIPTGAFENSSIQTFNIPANVIRIGAFAFKNCKNLVSINLPDSICDPMEDPENEYWIEWILNALYEREESYDDNAGIGEGAFEGCTSLTTVNIPKFMFNLGRRAFYGCTSLKEITLPEGLEVIGAEAFAETGLVEIVIPETIVMIGNFNERAESDKDRRGESTWRYGAVFANCTSLKKVVFESVVSDIVAEAFIGCTALEEVVFANGWTTISDGMFSGCTSLNIDIPDTVEVVGTDAFAGWTAEQTITIHIPLETANNLWGEGWNGGATVVVK